MTGSDVNGQARLDAYFVGEPDGTVNADDLRRFLRQSLPLPLIPSTFTVLNALPMTPVKEGRSSSPRRPGVLGHGANAAVVAPRDDVETKLVAIWEEVLDLRPVGVTDSFFELGGHSLLAIRLLARVEEVFGRRLALSALFVGPTVEDLAAQLRLPERDSAGWTPLVPIQPAGSLAPFFCVHPAGGIVYCFQELARRLGSDRPFFAFQSAGLDDDRPPVARLEEMAASYITAMREVQPEGPYHIGGWSLGGIVAFEMAERARRAGQARRHACHARYEEDHPPRVWSRGGSNLGPRGGRARPTRLSRRSGRPAR